MYDVIRVSDVLDPNETRSEGWALYYRFPEENTLVIAECGDSSEGNAQTLAKMVGRRAKIGRLIESGQGAPQAKWAHDLLSAKRDMHERFGSPEFEQVAPPEGWRPLYDERQKQLAQGGVICPDCKRGVMLPQDRCDKCGLSWDSMTMQDERTHLLARLRQIAAGINSFYPRPYPSDIPTAEEALRAEARRIEARLEELANPDHYAKEII